MPLVKIADKLVYFAHVPKCAGTAIERYLEQRFGQTLGFIDPKFMSVPEPRRWTKSSPQHVDRHSLARLLPAHFIDARFAVVRHPARRLLSAFRFRRDVERILPDDARFDDWLDRIEAPGEPFANDNHSRPMSDFVPEGSALFRLEDGLAAVVDWLDGIAGATAPSHQIAMVNTHAQGTRFRKDDLPEDPPLTTAQIARVRDIYAVDFERFGYS